MKFSSRATFVLSFVWIMYGCSNGQGQRNGQPSDSRVITDMDISKDGLVDAYCVKGKNGEQYWHPDDKTWYWDRGVVVKRKANISGAPEAVVIVRGIARYHVNDNGYSYYKFLTTDNQYEGIPAPSKGDLTEFVKQELAKVFMGRAHNIVEVGKIDLSPDPWIWHNAGSFTATYNVAYREVVSYTDIADREGTFSIRFYRDDVNSPIKNLLATEGDRKNLKRTTYTQDEIKQMKSIQDM